MQRFAKESSDACNHEAVFKHANQFHPRFTFVSERVEESFPNKSLLLASE